MNARLFIMRDFFGGSGMGLGGTEHAPWRKGFLNPGISSAYMETLSICAQTHRQCEKRLNKTILFLRKGKSLSNK